ncbi:peroxidase family protein [Aspergillus saccharolyticus JOP 1030-1]|uniref:Cloroperoxidase n=1 Tax=Aspergillus saccharolyticus JOP 1030-1 TaxID=1450539 RepID=A0A318YZP4_9EURO|nr:Cloroperoxidase [Aspergillus saccharolyticus JOP 1030-1]PYH40186.1 Cloroperoxidase [Aspergillus saccharolyticus JOP 1030-1]
MNLRALTLLSLASLALALPELGGHDFRAPGPFDSRSPCPGLNALANHGYLPRDGKNIDYEMINQAAQDAYNFESGFYVDAVNMVFLFNISTTTRPNETFHLFDLARHDTIEADGSLTRNDIYFGDDVHFDATVWAPVARDLGLDHRDRPADRFVTVETAASATRNRYALAKHVNPQFNASMLQQQFEYGTTALYLLTLWDDDQNAAPKAWVKALMGEDRIPFQEGFTRPKVVKTSERIQNMTVAVRAAAGAGS